VVVKFHAFLTSALFGGEWSNSPTAALPPGYPLDRGWEGPTVGQDVVAKKQSHYCPFRELNPGRPARNLVSILIKLNRLCLFYEINLKEYFVKYCIFLSVSGSRQGPVADYCKHDNETSGFIKTRNPRPDERLSTSQDGLCPRQMKCFFSYR
jgi:hypothetical protein